MVLCVCVCARTLTLLYIDLLICLYSLKLNFSVISLCLSSLLMWKSSIHILGTLKYIEKEAWLEWDHALLSPNRFSIERWHKDIDSTYKIIENRTTNKPWPTHTSTMTEKQYKHIINISYPTNVVMIMASLRLDMWVMEKHNSSLQSIGNFPQALDRRIKNVSIPFTMKVLSL